MARALAPSPDVSLGFRLWSLVSGLVSTSAFLWWWLYVERHIRWGRSNLSWRWVVLLKWLRLDLTSLWLPMTCYQWIFLLFCYNMGVDVSASLVCFFDLLWCFYFGNNVGNVLRLCFPSICYQMLWCKCPRYVGIGLGWLS